MIVTERLSKRYSGGNYALRELTVTASRKVTSIIGRNGAGKTTLIRILSTQLLPSGGRATVEGYDVVSEAHEIRKRIVSIPQEAAPIGILTAFEQVKMYLVGRGYSFKEAGDSANRALDQLELREAKNMPTDTLSGGMKRKMFVAMALAANADVVFLDEPTTGLDPLSRLEVWSAIRQIDSTIILTTHYMEEAEQLSNEVILIERGQSLEQGTPAELVSRFSGKVRVETTERCDGCIHIGNISIMYVDRSKAEEYIDRGYTVRPVTLEDIFISRGVEIES